MELEFNPPQVAGQEISIGTVSVSSPVPANYLVSLISADSTSAYVPPVVLITEGLMSATFRVATSPVPADRPVKITATAPHQAATASADLRILAPAVSAVATIPADVVGGDDAAGLVTLSNPAAAGFVIALTSSRPDVATVPPTLAMAPGQTAAGFPIQTSAVRLSQSVDITATAPDGDSMVGATGTIRVEPPTVTGFLLPTDAKGGTSIEGAFALSCPAPADFAVSFQSSVPNAASAAPVTVLAGQNMAAVSVDVHTVAVSTITVLSAVTPAGTSKDALPLVISPVLITAVTFDPTAISGGQMSVGTVTLDSPAPEGYQVGLASSNPTHIIVPASVTFATGATTATFDVAAKSSDTGDQVTITATAPTGTVTTGVITLSPVAITGITFNPPTVPSGNGSTGTVILNCNAVSDFLIQLSSADPSLIHVPPSVTVKAGTSTATFPATSEIIRGNRSVTITGQDPNGTVAHGVLKLS